MVSHPEKYVVVENDPSAVTIHLVIDKQTDLPLLLSKVTIQHGNKPRHCPVWIPTNVRWSGGSIRLWFNIQQSWGNTVRVFLDLTVQWANEWCHCECCSLTNLADFGCVCCTEWTRLDERLNGSLQCRRLARSCDSVPESRCIYDHVAPYHYVQGASWTHSQWTHKLVWLLLKPRWHLARRARFFY